MRLANRPLAFILAAALGSASVLVIVEVIAVAAHHRGPLVVPWTTWYLWASRTRWDQLVIQIWSAILIAVGLALLVLELKPARVTRLRLRSQHDATDAAVTRRGLARTLRSAAIGIDGISAAAVTVSRRRARVTATAAARGPANAEALRQPVTETLQGRLDDMGLSNPPALTVRVSTRGG